MSSSDASSFDPAEFTGEVRLFPLPNVVLFPHAILPLHIFEPRYRELMQAALADDQCITLALLAPGWEADYEGRPPLQPLACLGRVTTHQRLPDGRYNLLLEGLARVRLLEELPPRHAFREARAELVPDVYPQSGAAVRPERQRQLLDRFRHLLAPVPDLQEPLAKLLGAGLTLGPLTDILAFMLDLGLEFKQSLLAEPDADARAERLLSRLAEAPPAGAARKRWKYPPDFSAN